MDMWSHNMTKPRVSNGDILQCRAVWLAQKSDNKAQLRFRSGRPLLPITHLQVSPSLPM